MNREEIRRLITKTAILNGQSINNMIARWQDVMKTCKEEKYDEMSTMFAIFACISNDVSFYASSMNSEVMKEFPGRMDFKN